MEDSPRLIVVDDPDGRTLPLSEGELTVGRSKTCDLRIPDGSLSKTHAWIVWRDGELQVRDAGSRNGVFVGGERIDDATLQNGDVVTFGKIRLEVAGLPEEPKPQHGPVLRLVDGEQVWPLNGETVTIGSHRTNDVVINGEGVSRYHAEISVQGETFWVQDLGARNGILRRGTKIQQEPLEPGDELTLGKIVLRFEIQKAPAGAELRELLGALRQDPVGTLKTNRRAQLGAVAAVSLLVLGVLFAPNTGGDYKGTTAGATTSNGHWLSDGTDLLLAGKYADARTLFRKAKIKLPQHEQRTPQVLERVADMWDSLEERGHERFRWSKAEDLLASTARLKGLDERLRDWFAEQETFVALNKGAAETMRAAEEVGGRAKVAAGEHDVKHALELFTKATDRFATVPSGSLYAPAAREQVDALSLQAFEMLVAGIERGSRAPRPDWRALEGQVDEARAFASTTEHRNRLRSLSEYCRVNRSDEDAYVRAYKLIGTEDPRNYDRAEELLKKIDRRSRIHPDAQGYLGWLAADRLVRKASIAYNRADGRAAFELLREASQVPGLGPSARRSVTARHTHWSRVVRAYDRGMAGGRDLDEAIQELSLVVRLETNRQNLYRQRAEQELNHIRKERQERVEKRLQAGLSALRASDYVKATKAFDDVRADPVHDPEHLDRIRTAVARLNADEQLLATSKRVLIRDRKREFQDIRDKLTLLAKWLPRAHADREPALKHLAVVIKRIRAWKMK